MGLLKAALLLGVCLLKPKATAAAVSREERCCVALAEETPVFPSSCDVVGCRMACVSSSAMSAADGLDHRNDIAFRTQKELRMQPGCAPEEWVDRCPAQKSSTMLVAGTWGGGCVAAGCIAVQGGSASAMVLAGEEADDAILRAVTAQEEERLLNVLPWRCPLKAMHKTFAEEEASFRREVDDTMKSSPDIAWIASLVEEAATKGFDPSITEEAKNFLIKHELERRAFSIVRRIPQVFAKKMVMLAYSKQRMEQDMRREIERREHRMAELAKANLALEAELAAASVRETELVQDFERRMHRAVAEKDQCVQRMTGLQEDLIASQKNVTSLTEALGSTKAELVASEAETTKQKDALAWTEAELANTREKLNGTKADASSLSDALASTEADLTSSEVKTAKLKDALNWHEAELANTRAQLTRAKAEVGSLSDTLGAAMADLTATKAENTGLTDNLASTAQNLTSTQAELGSLAKALASTVADLATSKAETSHVKHVLASTAAELTTLDAKLTLEAQNTFQLHDAARVQAEERQRSLAGAKEHAAESPDMRLRLLEDMLKEVSDELSECHGRARVSALSTSSLSAIAAKADASTPTECGGSGLWKHLWCRLGWKADNQKNVRAHTTAPHGNQPAGREGPALTT